MNANNRNRPMPAAYDLASAVARARTGPDTVLLEGFHALKHALRFGASVDTVVTPNPTAYAELFATLAPDLVAPTPHEVDAVQWRELAGTHLTSPSLAVAHRPRSSAHNVLTAVGDAPVIAMIDPQHAGNAGAVIRVAAAAAAAGVLIIGDLDPWHPTVIRTSAGLGFALPVARADQLETQRPLVALDPAGSPPAAGLPAGAVLLVGTERAGLPTEYLDRAAHRLRLPMRSGVSSLNLATAVAAALYSTPIGSWRAG